ncbi:MAG TPA: RidA family protein, partial [Micromonosporaceae bacterium]
MSLERLNPPQLHQTPGYHHVTIASPGRWIFLAGQCPLDASGAVVGGDDVLAQVDQVVANTKLALSAAQVGPDDVVRTVIYVVTDQNPVLGSVWRRFTTSELGPAFSTASTLVGVARLGFTGQLVELDVT